MKHYTIKHKIPGISFNQLEKVDAKGEVAWMLESDPWGFRWESDRYFSEKDIDALDPELKKFVQSEFCEVTKV